MSPPNAASCWRAIASPSPVPPVSRAVVKKRSNIRSLLPGDMPPPSSHTSTITSPASPRAATRTFRGRRAAGCSRAGWRARRRAIRGRSRPAASPAHRRPTRPAPLVAQPARPAARPRPRRRPRRPRPQRVGPRQLEDAAHQPLESRGVVQDVRRNSARSVGRHLLEMVPQQLGAAADAGQRRLELVADTQRQLPHIVGARLQRARHARRSSPTATGPRASSARLAARRPACRPPPRALPSPRAGVSGAPPCSPRTRRAPSPPATRTTASASNAYRLL